jgi:DNA-binding NarL/FixJ family response regulator
MAQGIFAHGSTRTSQADVILVDYRLGVAWGNDVTRQLKAVRPDVRVIGMSSDEYAREKMLAAGADAFYSKSDVEQLVGGLRQLSHLNADRRHFYL